MIIAIDGTAGAGKTTIARALAHHLGVPHINTGGCYRAVALYAHENNLKPDNPMDVRQLLDKIELVLGNETFLLSTYTPFAEDHEERGRSKKDCTMVVKDRTADLFTAATGDLTRPWTPIPAIRAFCTGLWQMWVEQAENRCGGCVVEGRDTGRVIRSAALRIWVTADIESRVLRRVLQSDARQSDGDLREQLVKRDHVDYSLGNGPLEDAFILDTTTCTVDEALAMVRNVMRVLRIQPRSRT